MSDVFISYARSTEAQAHKIAEALRGLGYGVWRDDELPAHRAFADVIDERLRAARAVVVIWSAEAVKSQWVQSEADRAREEGKLVQLTLDGAKLPMPFDRIQCADMTGWSGEQDAPGWRKVVASVADLVGGSRAPPQPAVAAPVTDAPPPLPSKPSIAVMPFANLSADADQEYFADGMVEEIAAALSRFRSIFVIGIGSTLSFKGKSISPPEAARSLGVRYVLEGSVRRASGRVRIAVKLTDASDGAQIWADRFEDTLEDVFALQDKVALGVAGAIEPTIRAAEIRRAAARPTDNMGSYDLYLRALPLQRTFGRAGTCAALDLLHRAIDLDRDFAAALSLAGFCHAWLVSCGWSDDRDGERRQSIELVNRALRVSAEDSEAMAYAAATFMQFGRDLDAAIALIDRAIALNPGQSLAWMIGGHTRMAAGRTQEAIERLETSIRLDPRSPWRPFQLYGLGVARFQEGRFADAAALLDEAAHLIPEAPHTYPVLAACYGHLGQVGAAQAALARYRSLAEGEIGRAANLRDLGHRKLFLDGIALAEGKSPAHAPRTG